MSTPAASKPPVVVRIARAIRHVPGLRALAPLWDALRKPYLWLLNRLARKEGLPLFIEGIGVVRVPPTFLTCEVDVLEVPMLRRMVEWITPDCCFYDLGASIGLHSLVAGRQLTATGEIHAFEPDLPSCATYWSNLELVRRKLGVRLSRAFVSEVSFAPAPLELFPTAITELQGKVGDLQTRHLYLFEEENRNEADGVIPRVSLDAYVQAGARPPSVIKCDVEGAELLFLRGAVEVLRSRKPVLFISLHPQLVGKFGYGPRDFFDFLGSLNYTWEILSEEGECHVFATAV